MPWMRSMSPLCWIRSGNFLHTCQAEWSVNVNGFSSIIAILTITKLALLLRVVHRNWASITPTILHNFEKYAVPSRHGCCSWFEDGAVQYQYNFSEDHEEVYMNHPPGYVHPEFPTHLLVYASLILHLARLLWVTFCDGRWWSQTPDWFCDYSRCTCLAQFSVSALLGQIYYWSWMILQQFLCVGNFHNFVKIFKIVAKLLQVCYKFIVMLLYIVSKNSGQSVLCPCLKTIVKRVSH